MREDGFDRGSIEVEIVLQNPLFSLSKTVCLWTIRLIARDLYEECEAQDNRLREVAAWYDNSKGEREHDIIFE